MNSGNARLGPIILSPGVSPLNAAVFIYAAFIGITLNTFVNFIQPYVLTEQLGIPDGQQGRISGDLVFYAEMVLVAGCAAAGIAADRYGRRAVFAAGFTILSVGYLLYGFVDSSAELFALRMFMACGIACINVLVTTLTADYPVESSRGKLVGVSGFAIGLGALFLVFALAPLPSYFSQHTDALRAGRYTLFTAAAIAVISAVVCGLGLAHHKSTATIKERKRWIAALRESIDAARSNSRVALAYCCAFVARGDLIVIGVFFTLWMTQEGIAAGLSSADAIKRAGLFFGLIQGTALLWAPVQGILNDRIDRVTATVIGLALAAIGYGSLGLIGEPLGTGMYICAVLLGIGQMSVMLASQTLIGQEAPQDQRGAVTGMYSICGALGIMFVTKVGGWLFDSWQAGPFVLVAVLNVVLCFGALALRLSGPARSQVSS